MKSSAGSETDLCKENGHFMCCSWKGEVLISRLCDPMTYFYYLRKNGVAAGGGGLEQSEGWKGGLIGATQ